jgi:HEPN domain-containing protein
MMDMKEIRRITQHTFANQQSNEESWYRSAISFHEGVNVLEQHLGSIRGGKLVILTNAALSIELLLKAIIVAKGGKAPITHRLLGLARDAGVVFSKNQEATLELLGEVLKWSGRYPVPNKVEDWDHYYDDVFERHVIREREGNVGIVRANPETFPSVKNYEKLWDLANRKWGEIQLNRQQPKIGTTADLSLHSE